MNQTVKVLKAEHFFSASQDFMYDIDFYLLEVEVPRPLIVITPKTTPFHISCEMTAASLKATPN